MRRGSRRAGAREAARPRGSEGAGSEPQRPAARLGELLVERGVVTPAQLDDALELQARSGLRLGAQLVASGAVDERTLTQVLAEQLGVGFVDIDAEDPDEALTASLPAELVQRGALPVAEMDGVLLVAVSDLHEADLAAIRAAAGRPTRMLLAPASSLRRAIDDRWPPVNGSAGPGAAVPRTVAGLDRQIEAFTAVQSARRGDGERAGGGASDAPVVQTVNLVITQALQDRASDVHIEPQQSHLRVRYRIDGVLHDVFSLPGSMAAPILSRIKIMANMNIVERRRPQDGQMSVDLQGRSVDVRVATTPTIWGEKAALRLLDRSRPLLKLSELGVPADTYRQYLHLLRSPIGMVIAAGPSGSGKTTTLYSTLSEIDAVERNITTIEDPVEYVFPRINQIPINEQAGITFASGLRSILRQDPDVILVGEVRDTETARIAVQSALTGHFVLSSLHAQDSVSALHRFLDMGIEAFLVASSVIGVVGQRLLRRTCAVCRTRYRPPPDELAFYEQLGGDGRREFTRGRGCQACANTGYQSRVGVFELLHVTDDVKQVLVDRGSQRELRAVAAAAGMRSLQEEGVRLVAEDVTTIAEVARMIFNP